MDYRNLTSEELNWWNRRAEDKTAFIIIEGKRIYFNR